MYRFTDVTEKGSTMLPSEALRINGKYIEELVKGYKTLNVKGRELLLADIDEYSTGGADGTSMRRRKYPARVITVTFQLIAETNEQYRRAFEKLNAVLNVEDAQLIFDDEKDRYYIGTPSSYEDIDPGRNAVVGKFSIKCFDPFKYALTEKVITANKDNVFEFNYAGTYPAHPHFEVSLPTTSCGYMAFINQDGKIIQLGDPEEVDGFEIPPSELLEQVPTFNSSEWTINANGLPNLRGNITLNGSLEPMNDRIAVASYGSGPALHGVSVTKKIKADSLRRDGAANFRCSWTHRFYATSNNQLGEFQVLLCNNTGGKRTLVAGFSLTKLDNTIMARQTIYGGDVNGSIPLRSFPVTFNNVNTGVSTDTINTINTCTITKIGDRFIFNLYGTKHSLIVSGGTLDVNEVSFVFATYGTAPALALSRIYNFKFIKDHADTFVDIPNKFSQGDEVQVDGDYGKIYLNKLATPEYGAIGNDWEGFKLTQGANRINVSMSDWTKNAQLKLKYRERYI